MVFIGDFVPNIIALIFPEDWAQDTMGHFAIKGTAWHSHGLVAHRRAWRV